MQEISVLKQVVLGLRSSRHDRDHDYDSLLRSSHKSSNKQHKTTLFASNNISKQTTSNGRHDESTVGKPIVFVSFFFF